MECTTDGSLRRSSCRCEAPVLFTLASSIRLLGDVSVIPKRDNVYSQASGLPVQSTRENAFGCGSSIMRSRQAVITIHAQSRRAIKGISLI